MRLLRGGVSGPLRRGVRHPGPSTRRVARITELAAAAGSTPEESAALVRTALATVRRDGLPERDDPALLGRLVVKLPDADAARGRLLLLLVDLEQRPLAETAALLALPPEEASGLLTRARRQSGSLQLGGSCRGWGLVAARQRVTAAERSAGEGHLLLCRRCRDGLTRLERERRELLARTSGVAALLAGAELTVLAAGGTAGAVAAGGGGLLAGKAAAALVGVLGAAVAVGGGVAATAQHSAGTDRLTRPAGVVRPADVRPDPLASPGSEAAPQSPAPSCCARTAPSSVPGSGAPLLRLPLPAPTAHDDLPAQPLPRPSVPPLPSLPPLPVLPLELPSELPSGPPTGLPLPVPVPTLPLP